MSLKASRRLNQGHLLKEEFGQLRTCEREGLARRFFENWFAVLKRQGLKPYRKIADMIDRHWDGIVVYRKSGSNIALGFVEGMNNKIRVQKRLGDGLCDEEDRCLNVLTCLLDPIQQLAEIVRSGKRRPWK